MIRRRIAAVALRAAVYLAAPQRSEMKDCPHCGTANDPDRGSKNCWKCAKPMDGSS